ncbi:MAG: hypothetical protein AAB651_00710 [Patescibacteria group bacterium]
MKKVLAVVLAIVITYLAVQVYFIFKERSQLREKVTNLSGRLDDLLKENERIQSEISYYSKWENLEKELRSRLNYKKIGEKMMIIVP